MAFDCSPKADELVLQGNKSTEVLREIDTPFEFLSPQEISDLGEPFYPFVFQDLERAYFAMPTYDSPRRVRQAFTNPFLDIQVEIDDVLVSTIPFPDKGDSAPVQFGPPPLARRSGRGTTRISPLRLMKRSNGSVLLIQDQRKTSGLVTVQELETLSQPMMLKSGKVEGFQVKATGVEEQLTVHDKVKVQSLYLKFH